MKNLFQKFYENFFIDFCRLKNALILPILILLLFVIKLFSLHGFSHLHNEQGTCNAFTTENKMGFGKISKRRVGGKNPN
jgi:hypothetical protein